MVTRVPFNSDEFYWNGSLERHLISLRSSDLGHARANVLYGLAFERLTLKIDLT
jgi:hypothetical protein